MKTWLNLLLVFVVVVDLLKVHLYNRLRAPEDIINSTKVNQKWNAGISWVRCFQEWPSWWCSGRRRRRAWCSRCRWRTSGARKSHDRPDSGSGTWNSGNHNVMSVAIKIRSLFNTFLLICKLWICNYNLNPWRRILDGNRLICCKKWYCLIEKTEDKRKRGRIWPIKKPEFVGEKIDGGLGILIGSFVFRKVSPNVTRLETEIKQIRIELMHSGK